MIPDIFPGMAAAEFSPTCNQHLFDRYVDSCLSQFQESMELSGYQDSCPWPGVKRYFIILLILIHNTSNT